MRGRSGFTLIELLVTIIVLAILGGVAVVKYNDYSVQAKASAEAAVVGAVRAGIDHWQKNAALGGNPGWPSTLDAAPASGAASAATPYFGGVLDPPVVAGWTKGSTARTYIAPSGATYVYNQINGTFGSESSAPAQGGGPTAGAVEPAYRSATTYVAGTDPSGPVGTGYAAGAGNELDLTDATPNFTEESRRVAVFGQQAISAGDYALTLDTRLTDYWTQLNYWEVIGVKNGTTLSLSGNTLSWYGGQPGVGILYQDYAPPEKSNGSWYSYNTTFHISQAQAAQYDELMVIVAGSRGSGQILGWRNVTLKKQP